MSGGREAGGEENVETTGPWGGQNIHSLYLICLLCMDTIQFPQTLNNSDMKDHWS